MFSKIAVDFFVKVGAQVFAGLFPRGFRLFFLKCLQRLKRKAERERRAFALTLRERRRQRGKK